MTKKAWSRAASLSFISPPPTFPPPQLSGLIVWQRAPSPLLPPTPPPDVLPNFKTKGGSHGTLAHDPPFHPPTPSPTLPLLNEGQYCPLALVEIRRGVKLRKVKKQTCELDMNTARQMLLKQIRQGVKLKPVSSNVTKSDP